ncbi:MAG: hypothetical protein AAGD14_18775 [Planctomycetota bacterium]
MACGGDEPVPDTGNETGAAPDATRDGFLDLLPERASITLRLPRLDRIAAEEMGARGLLDCFGLADSAALFYASAEGTGIDRARAAGLVRTTQGAWSHFLPSADKGQLNGVLRDRAGRQAVREERDYIVVGTAPAGTQSAATLPAGDFALRLSYHPLLDEIAQPGDVLELGGTLAAGGCELAGALRPAEKSPTLDALRRAGNGWAGHLDLLPAWLPLRFESTMPPTIYATMLARRIGRHAGLPEGELRDNMERFLREVATGIDAQRGLAIGVDLKGGKLSMVAVGLIAEGPDSPILTKLRRESRTTFGGLVLDARELTGKDKQKGRGGFYAWIPESAPTIEGLPMVAQEMLIPLVDEDRGVPVSYARTEGYGIVAAGPRADLLVRRVRQFVEAGARMSAGTLQLRSIRDRGGEAPLVFAAIVAGTRWDALESADATALRAALGANADAEPPKLIVLAGFREEDRLALHGRIVFQ